MEDTHLKRAANVRPPPCVQLRCWHYCNGCRHIGTGTEHANFFGRCSRQDYNPRQRGYPHRHTEFQGWRARRQDRRTDL